jgi:SecD/SecF fusion protein
VLSLLIFGGSTLKDFAFALLVGIASGAYSSIFVAAPLLTIWKEREPEFARRRGETIGKREAEATLEAAEEAAAAEPAPEFAAVAPGDGASTSPATAQAKRERRRQRRRARPHGRAH